MMIFYHVLAKKSRVLEKNEKRRAEGGGDLALARDHFVEVVHFWSPTKVLPRWIAGRVSWAKFFVFLFSGLEIYRILVYNHKT